MTPSRPSRHDYQLPAKPARHRSRPSAIGFASGECRAVSGEAGGSAGNLSAVVCGFKY